MSSQKSMQQSHPHHKQIGLDYWTDADNSYSDILVVPSQNLDSDLNKTPGASHYEERLLFNLILLRNPQYRVVYVSSLPIHEGIIEYYWDLIMSSIAEREKNSGKNSQDSNLLHHSTPFSEVKHRLLLYNCNDDRSITLTRKILSRPKLLKRLDKALPNKTKSCMSVYIASPLEQQLADRLGITLLAGHAEKHAFYGSKFGCKQLFSAVGIPTPDYSKLVFSSQQLAEEVAALMEKYPDCQKMVVKLNEGFSGQGCAILDVEAMRADMEMRLREGGRLEGVRSNTTPSQANLQNLRVKEDARDVESSTRDNSPLPTHESKAPTSLNKKSSKYAHLTDIIQEHFKVMKMQGDGGKMSWKLFKSKISDLGVIAEVFVDFADEKNPKSPSCQAMVDTTGEVKILSTHEQVLGGCDNQQYMGCSFPASSKYRSLIADYTRRIGKYLAEKGIVGHYGVDYIEMIDPSKPEGWGMTAIEINLRLLGTSHPNMLCKLLTNSTYDEKRNICVTREGDEQEKCYVASDNIFMKEIQGLLPEDLREYEQCDGSLHFDPSTGTGVVFHLMGACSELGKVGATAIHNSPQEAQDLYDRFLEHFKAFASEDGIYGEGMEERSEKGAAIQAIRQGFAEEAIGKDTKRLLAAAEGESATKEAKARSMEVFL